MAIQIQGNANVVAEIEANTRALRVVPRSYDIGALGLYRVSMLSGTMAAGLAANSEIFQFRWPDATRFGLVTRITLDGLSGSATAFAAGFGKVDVLAARAFSANGTGGTAATMTTNNMKLRTNMGTSLISGGSGDIRCASTAALGTGTKTLDAQAFGQLSLSFGILVSVQYANQVDLFNAMNGGSWHPMVLAQNEGFAVRATVPATGTWQFGITVEWAEVAAY